MEVIRVEQRAYIKIAVLRGRNAMECHRELVEAIGHKALPYRTVAQSVKEKVPIRSLIREKLIPAQYTSYTCNTRSVKEKVPIHSLIREKKVIPTQYTSYICNTRSVKEKVPIRSLIREKKSSLI
ncbi:hypothetical protein TNCV_602781 [Trichonephila clavipes]|nr:hypothetical protein TNCV_602781 [Trichonephila clavipes]